MRRSGLTNAARAAKGRLYWWLHEAMISASPAAVPRQTRRPASPVLVVKPDNIGDFVLFSSILDTVRRFTGDRRLVLVCTAEVASLLPICPPTFDAVMVIDRRRYRRSPPYRLRVLARIRGLACGCVIHPVYSRDAIGDELALCTGIPEAISFAGDDSHLPRRCWSRSNRRYSRLISVAPDTGREIDRYRHLARTLEGGGRTRPQRPRLSAPQMTPAIARAVEGLGPWYVMFPGAADPYRRWRPGRYARLAKWIRGQYGLSPVICGAASDRTLARAIADRAGCGTASLCGQTDLPQLAAVLRSARFYVGSETGPLHMAAAVGTATLGIIGGGHFGRFYPNGDASRHVAAFNRMDCFGCHWRCVFDRPRCVGSISFETVAAGIERLMGAPAHQPTVSRRDRRPRPHLAPPRAAGRRVS